MTPPPLASIVLVVAAERSEMPTVLAGAGFIACHELISTIAPAADGAARRFDGVAVVLLESSIDPASLRFAGSMRTDTAVAPVPLLWLVPDSNDIPGALDAGADVALPADTPPGQLVAQVRSLIRVWEQSLRLGSRGVDTRTTNERLRKVFLQADQDAEFARRIIADFSRIQQHTSNEYRLAVSHRPATHGSVDFHDAIVNDGSLTILLVNLAGLGTVTGTLAAGFVMVNLLRLDVGNAKPTELMLKLNQRLLALPLPESAVVSATVARIDLNTGAVAVACAGLPAPVQVPTTGPASVWHGSGPFLGIAETTFPEVTGQLQPGEKLLLLGGTDAAERRPDVRAAASTIIALDAQAYVEALAEETLSETGGYTLVLLTSGHS